VQESKALDLIAVRLAGMVSSVIEPQEANE
jgi:hypothetical protein